MPRPLCMIRDSIRIWGTFIFLGLSSLGYVHPYRTFVCLYETVIYVRCSSLALWSIGLFLGRSSSWDARAFSGTLPLCHVQLFRTFIFDVLGSFVSPGPLWISSGSCVCLPRSFMTLSWILCLSPLVLYESLLDLAFVSPGPLWISPGSCALCGVHLPG